jgi:hypothetical protein
MRRWRWLTIGFAALLLSLLVGLSLLAGGPRNVYGLLRYALPNWHHSGSGVGDPAPDSQLVSLNGQSTFHLHERIRRPGPIQWTHKSQNFLFGVPLRSLSRGGECGSNHELCF